MTHSVESRYSMPQSMYSIFFGGGKGHRSLTANSELSMHPRLPFAAVKEVSLLALSSRTESLSNAVSGCRRLADSY